MRAATQVLFLLTLAQVGLTVWGNYWNRALFDALEQRTVRGVLVQVGVFALIFVISIAVTVAHLMVKRWMDHGRHYHLLFTEGEHDNPDQRIATEVAIALVHGEPIERAGSAVRFRQIVRDWDRQSLAYMGLVSFSTGYGGLLPVFPILIAAPQYISGAMSLGVLMQAAQPFQRLTGALSWPVDNVGEIAKRRAVIARLLELGAKVIDTARAYGDSEPVVARILADLRARERVFLATKTPIEGELGDPAGIVAETFRRLGADTVDLLQIHNMHGVDELLPTLRRLKDEKRVRYIGATTSRDGNLLRRLGDRPLPPWAGEIGAESWAQVLLKYVLSHPAVTCAIPGTTSVINVEANLRAARGTLPDAAMRRRMEDDWDKLAA